MTLSEFFNEHVARVLEVVFAPADVLFRAMPPWSLTACAVALLLIPGIAAFFLSRDFVYEGAPDRALWRDLRFWGILILLPYVALYLIF